MYLRIVYFQRFHLSQLRDVDSTKASKTNSKRNAEGSKNSSYTKKTKVSVQPCIETFSSRGGVPTQGEPQVLRQ